MAEGRADQNGARNGPEEDQRLPVGQAEADADEAVEKERAKDPRREIGLAETTSRADREDDRDRPRRREDEGDERVDGVLHREIANDLGPARQR